MASTEPPAAEPPALAHIEKTLADSYRKEIDQEENTWRSLPFFAATLALQLAALFQLLDRLPPLGTGLGWAALALLVISVACSVVALSILAASIYPAKFQYIAKDADLLDYALKLIRDEQDPANLAQAEPMNPLVTLKGTLAWQYSVATDHNRQINKRREKRRSIAGLATIAAVVSTLMLVAVTFAYYIPSHSAKGPAHGPEQPHPEPAAATPGGGTGAAPTTAPGAADAGRHQGLVDDARGAGERRGSGKGEP